MKRILIAVATFGGALWAGWQLLPAPPVTAEARPADAETTAVVSSHGEQVASPAATSICTGGMEGPLGVEIVPLRSVARAGGNVLRYAVQLRNRSNAALRARYALELVTDVGSPVLSPETSTPVDLTEAATTSDERDTPTALADGFYILRVTAVATGAGGDASELVHLFFEVTGGDVLQLDTEDFYARSNANKGVMR